LKDAKAYLIKKSIELPYKNKKTHHLFTI